MNARLPWGRLGGCRLGSRKAVNSFGRRTGRRRFSGCRRTASPVARTRTGRPWRGNRRPCRRDRRADHRLRAAQHGRDTCPAAPGRGLRVGLVLLRGDLDRYPPPAPGRGGGRGLVAATRAGGRRFGRLPCASMTAACWRSHWPMMRARVAGSAAGAVAGAAAAAAAFGADAASGGGGAPPGPGSSAGSPLDRKCPDPARFIVRHRAVAALRAAAPAGATLAAVGGLLFGFSGGNTTRGPVFRTHIDRRCPRADKIFSAPSPGTMRSGILAAPSAGAGTILVGLLSALMIGGSPLRGDRR